MWITTICANRLAKLWNSMASGLRLSNKHRPSAALLGRCNELCREVSPALQPSAALLRIINACLDHRSIARLRLLLPDNSQSLHAAQWKVVTRYKVSRIRCSWFHERGLKDSPRLHLCVHFYTDCISRSATISVGAEQYLNAVINVSDVGRHGLSLPRVLTQSTFAEKGASSHATALPQSAECFRQRPCWKSLDATATQT
jgi:hypothetical protein